MRDSYAEVWEYSPAMINRSAYVPILHPRMVGYYRTPVWVEPDSYTVCIAEDVYRYYNGKTVPQDIVALVSMVNAFPYKPRQPTIYIQDVYTLPDPKQVEIGWRIDDKLYILVLSDECLQSMYMKGSSDG